MNVCENFIPICVGHKENCIYIPTFKPIKSSSGFRLACVSFRYVGGKPNLLTEKKWKNRFEYKTYVDAIACNVSLRPFIFVNINVFSNIIDYVLKAF